MQYPRKQHRDHGRMSKRRTVLGLTLGVLTVCALWGAMAWSTRPAEVRTAENYRQIARYYTVGQQAFYAAEAGAEAARARLRRKPEGTPPVDQEPLNPHWQMVLGEPRAASAPSAAAVASATVADSTPQALTYHVVVRHAVDPSSNTVLRWGDMRGEGLQGRNTSSGGPLYIITSQGRQGDAQRTVEIEAAPEPPLTVPAALYVAGQLQIQNQRAYVSGMDSCGTQHQPGVSTSFVVPAAASQSAQETGSTTITEGHATLIGKPARAYRGTQVYVQHMIERLQEQADVVYAPDSVDVPQEAATARWGNPQPGATLQAPSSCTERHIIVYKPRHGPGYLGPGSTGCGVLLVEGDLVLQGDFAWYGAILVNGAVQLSGAGRKHITGGMVVAKEMRLDDGGETSLLYCSEAIAQQTRFLPLRVLSWREVSLASR